MANFRFVSSDSDLKPYADFRLARIDGQQAKTLKQFYEQIARELRFPDEFEFGLESLDDALNDLDWLEEDKIAVYITDTDAFLSQEKSDAKKVDVLNILDAAAEDWKWVDEEEEGVASRQLVILFQPSDSLVALFEKEDFAYDRAV
ncbi:barstar family protein [Larkinella terrae]|uniref:Barnase inhibitor n=1 Tax=Larkinella terrae TaxID=2025311 RepID=A0A7K0EHW7_9BACT|nr:barstar family protein [Larkinella terrae]MRS61056.1 barnase inhibitor [Larkinella terrae]